MRYQRFQTYDIPLSLASGTSSTASGSFNVDSNYDFYCHQISGIAVDSSGNVTKLPAITVLIRENSENWSPAAVQFGALFGSGEFPRILPVIHKIAGGSTLFANIYNLSASLGYTVSLQFGGVHVPKGQAYAPAMV